MSILSAPHLHSVRLVEGRMFGRHRLQLASRRGARGGDARRWIECVSVIIWSGK